MRRQLKTTSRSLFAIGAVATTMLLGGIARADVFDTTLASPNIHAANGSVDDGNANGNNPSWYNGAGNPQGGWTVSTDATSGIEVGLRAKYRFVNGVIHTPTNDYTVLPSAGPLALWNYEFSIDLRPGGNGGLTLADIKANTTLVITDLTASITATIHPLLDFPDNTGFGAGGSAGVTSTGKDKPATDTDWGAQNSENLGWSFAGFNPNAAHTYEFALTVINSAGARLGATTMDVIVTPEPSSVILLGTMLIGAFVVLRRRRLAA